MRRSVDRGAAACLAAALLLAGCGGDREAGAPIPPCEALRWGAPPERPSLVLLLPDTLRRDRIGIYGGPARTPALDRLAREGLLFTGAYSESPWTKPAMATLFAGLYPSQHGVLSHPELRRESGAPARNDVLAEGVTTLAERLREAGYETVAFVSNPWLLEEFGFAQGFERYEDGFAANDVPGTRVSEAGLQWLEERSGEAPYFLYLHYMDPHSPYGRPSREDVLARREALREDARPLRQHARGAIRKLSRFPDGAPIAGEEIPPSRALLELVYDQGVEAFDAALARFLEGFAERPEAEETALVVVSDHGEALFERGWIGHGFGLFDEEIAVPLLAKLPGIEGPERVRCPAGLLDLRATLCRYLELDCEGEGTSLLAPREGPDTRRARYLVSEGVKRKPAHRAIRSGRYKLLREPGGRKVPPREGRPRSPWSLYDLERDPEERRNLLAPDHFDSDVVPLFERLSKALPESVPERAVPEPGSAPLDAETRRRLEALGYGE